MTTKKTRRAAGEGSLYQRSDGLWMVQVTRTDGTTWQRGRKRKSDAAALLKEMLEQVGASGAQGRDGASRMTVERWMDHYIDDIAPGRVGPAQLRNFKSWNKVWIQPALGRKKVADVGPADVRSVLKRIQAAGRSGRTQQVVYRLLHQALAAARRDGLITSIPTEAVDLPKALMEEREPLTVEQARQVLAYLRRPETDPRVRARWLLGLVMGLRQAEALGLTVDRVDLDAPSIEVSWQLRPLSRRDKGGSREQRAYERDELVVEPHVEMQPCWQARVLLRPKSARSARALPIPDEVATALRDAIAAERRNKTAQDLLFTSSRGWPVNDKVDRRDWHALLIDSGAIPADTEYADSPDQHVSRHTAATLLLEAGVEEHVRMAILGHSSATANRIYSAVTDDTAGKALDASMALLAAGEEEEPAA